MKTMNSNSLAGIGNPSMLFFKNTDSVVFSKDLKGRRDKMKIFLKLNIYSIGLFMVISSNVFSQNLTNEDVIGLIDKVRKGNNIPAMAVIVFNSDGILISEIQGERILNSNDDAKIDDYFHIGSCAKSILVIIAAKMIEEGKLTWNTRFFDVFPELAETSREEYLDITLDDLFSCRAGIQPFTSGDEFSKLDASESHSRQAFIRHLIQQEPATDQTEDGFNHLYSNASYTMAAAMLEQVTGLTWEDLIQKTLSADLGFSVVFGWPNKYHENQPWGHAMWNNTFQAFAPDHDYKLPDIIAPAGDLSMKPLEYAKYVQLHLQGLRGRDNYLDSDTYQTIHYRHQGFSFGVINEESWGERFSTFNGSAGTFYCSTLIAPDSDFAFVIMVNSGSEDAVESIGWVSRKIIKKHYNLWWMFWM